MMEGKGMATIIDVAKEAGVSTATVSRVLNGSPNLTDATRTRVLEVMRKLNYRPNAVARSLVTGETRCLGIMLPDLNMPFWSQLAHELSRAAEAHGYALMVTNSPQDRDSYIRSYRALSRNMSGGIITSFINGTEEFLGKSLVPTVVIANANCSPSVSSNDRQGGTLAARHLIAKGCHNLVHIAGEMKYHRTSDERTYAFLEECKRNNVPCKVYHATTDMQKENDYRGIISDAFYGNRDMDGIFASNDIIASLCISTALSLGYRIPEDLKIVGYDDINISSMIFPSLTTIRQNYRLLAETSVEAVIDLMAGKPVPEHQIFPVDLVERKST